MKAKMIHTPKRVSNDFELFRHNSQVLLRKIINMQVNAMGKWVQFLSTVLSGTLKIL